jgi:ketosteroid isomerase-like protein
MSTQKAGVSALVLMFAVTSCGGGATKPVQKPHVIETTEPVDTMQLVITGKEEVPDIHAVEMKALIAFYKAFNERNMQLMEANWLLSEEVSMDNPIGGIRRGWQEIKEGYDRIFNGKASVYVEFYDYTLHTTPEMFFVTGRERGYFKTGEQSLTLAIRTSRIFVWRNGEWKQIHHHGSIDSPELLKVYQDAVKK